MQGIGEAVLTLQKNKITSRKCYFIIESFLRKALDIHISILLYNYVKLHVSIFQKQYIINTLKIKERIRPEINISLTEQGYLVNENI